MTTLKYIAETPLEYATLDSAGIDLRADDDYTLAPPRSANLDDVFLSLVSIRTGVRVEIPPGYFGLVQGRSGLAFKHGVWCYTGTIDHGYRGEIGIQLVALLDRYTVRAGDRIAQLIILPVARCELVKVTQLSESERGERGFGSSGVR